jgi:hypothetical protein
MRSHIFLVTPPVASHAVGVYHVAAAIASPNRQVHILIHSQAQSKRCLRFLGQTLSSNIAVDVLAYGRWEGWMPATSQELLYFSTSPDLVVAVDAAIRMVENTYPGDKCTALGFDPSMAMLGVVAARRALKYYLLMPTSHYYTRLGGCHIEGEPLSTCYSLHGLGGSGALEVELNDVADLTMPAYYRHVKPAIDNSAGIIFSNSNAGLEGEQFGQPHLPAPHYAQKPTFMVGPCLPRWFEDALEDAWERDKHMQALGRDASIDFLDAQQDGSVVSVSLISIDVHEWQVRAIVDGLRKHSIRWLVNLPQSTAASNLKEIFAGANDGIVAESAPQLEILSHRAVKCVISQGDLGTVMAGTMAGQCFVMWPLEADQFLNAKVLAHLGLSSGTIMLAKQDDTRRLRHLFNDIFGSEDDENGSQEAKAASLSLRKRIKQARIKEGPLQIQALCRDMVTPATHEEVIDGSQHLFPSFVLGPW